MHFLYCLFNRFRGILPPLISGPKPQNDTSSQQPPQESAHEDIFGADGSPTFGKIIGAGVTGWVLRISEDRVLKVPRLRTNFADEDPKTQISYKNYNDAVVRCLAKEKEVYKRLGQFEGILPVWPTDAGIEFPYMPGGTVEEYLDTHDNIDLNIRLQWIKTVTSVVRRVHKERIIINDFGLRNFLLGDDLSLVVIDFGNSTIVPNNVKFGDFVDRACSEKSDIASIGSLIYEIITRKCYMVHVNLLAPFDVTESTSRHNGVDMWFPYWPPKEELAGTTDIFLGDIILQCWLKDGFQTMGQVCEAIAQTVG